MSLSNMSIAVAFMSQSSIHCFYHNELGMHASTLVNATCVYGRGLYASGRRRVKVREGVSFFFVLCEYELQ